MLRYKLHPNGFRTNERTLKNLPSKPKETTKHYKVYFDFETVTNKTHTPYLVRYEPEDDDRREFIGENCAEDMLNNLPYEETHFTNCSQG